MADGPGTPGSNDPPRGPGSPPRPAAPGAKRPAIGLQLKLPCATVEDVKARYGEDLKANRFFIRTKQPRAAETLVRLEAQLSSGAPCFRAAGVVVTVREASATAIPQPGQEPGMGLQLLAVDEAGRDLILALRGKPPPPFKSEARPAPAAPQGEPVKPSPAAGAAAVAQAPAPAATSTPATTSASAVAASGVAAPSVSAAESPVAAAPAPVDSAKRGQAESQPAAAPHASAPPRSEGAPGEGEARKGPIIGIDLGTTNSCAAVVQKGKPLVIPSREGYNTIPSIVAVNDKGKTLVGHPAKGQMLTNPGNTVFGAKRLIGRAFSSTVVTELAGRFPYRIVSGPRGEAAVQLGDHQLSLQKISSMVLLEVKDIAQQYLKTAVTRAVITVPAYYNDNQRQAVRQAGALAGLFVERILNEPTSAALAFAHGRTLDERVLVYDLGGGTFDASVLELHGNVHEVISTGGDTFLGGSDFDNVIVDHLLRGFQQQHGIEFPGDRVALQRVTDAAERAKIALSEATEHEVRVPFVAMVADKPYDLVQILKRDELVRLTNHLVDRTLKVCEDVLASRGLKPADIDEVLLVGGQSRMPLVRERVRGYFGREPSRAVHPDEAVALGAALLARSLDSSDIDGIVLVDVLPMSIGVGLPGGRFKKVIERNTRLPHQRQLSISTSKDDQTQLEIAVFQGENERAQENEYLGTLIVRGLPRGPRGSTSLSIQFGLSPECLLTVSAVDPKSGVAASMTFSTQDTPEAVRKKLEEDGSTHPSDASPDAGSSVFGWVKRILGGKGDAPRAR
jgi:molecular chaperone DnaK